MSAKRRRWPWIVAGGVLLGAMTAGLIAVEWYTTEPPNYAEVEPGLFVGGLVPAPPRGTAAVMNLCESEDPYRAEFHEWHPIRDASPAPSLKWLRERVAFIRTHRTAGRVVYVHCRNGVSRSVMVVAAYLMREHGITVAHALAVLKAKRDLGRPNPAFRDLLRMWEAELVQTRPRK